MVSFGHRLLFVTRGVLSHSPPNRPDDTKKPKGLKWEYQVAAADAGGARVCVAGAGGPARLR